MTGPRQDELDQDSFDTWALIEHRKAGPRTVVVKVDDKAATRQQIISELRRKKIEFMTRSDWKAKEAKAVGLAPDWHYQGIALHHAGNSYTCDANGADKMRRVQETHFKAGSADVGYHYGIDCKGTVFEGRDVRFLGAHIGEKPRVLGIVLLADMSNPGEERRIQADLPWWKKTGFGVVPMYDDISVRHDDGTEPQIQSLYSLVTTLKEAFSKIRYFGGHREWAKKTEVRRACPGAYGMILAEMVRKEFNFVEPEWPLKDL